MSTTNPRHSLAHDAVPATLEHRLQELGGVPADRVLAMPMPGCATPVDLIEVNERHGKLCELVDGTLVEKAMGYEASVVAAAILSLLHGYVSPNRLGLVSGADGFFRLPSSIRGPDVAFVHRDRLPMARIPKDPIPSVIPNLVVEVLSPGNTRNEMARKRVEYFSAGAQMVWIVDCVHRTVAVYRSTASFQVLGPDDLLHGEEVLPGFQCQVADFFADLETLQG